MKKTILSVSLIFLFLARAVAAVTDGAETNTAFPAADGADEAKRSTSIIVKKRSEPVQTGGVTLGSFLFIPSITLTEYHDDNIYATETNRRSDEVTAITPNFNLKSRWSRHRLDVNAGMDLTRYADYTSENTNDYWLGLSGRYDFSARQNVFAGLNYSREHEDRASPDAISGDTPTKYDDYRAHLGHSFTTGNHRTRLAYTFNRLDFKDVTSTGGVIDNNDRDRTEQAIGARYSYKYSPVMALYVEGIVDNRQYDITPDYSGNDRNSDGYRYSAGMEYAGQTNRLKIFAGVLGRDYQSAVFNDQSAFDFGLDYVWHISAQSRLMLQGGRSIEETTFNNSSGYLMTNASVSLQIGIQEDKNIVLNAGKSAAAYYEIDRNDDYYDYSLGYNQQLLANLRAGIEFRRTQRNSNVAANDYIINQIFLRVSGVM